MKKNAEQALNKEIITIVTSDDYRVVKNAIHRLVKLSDILDSMGNEKDADHIDKIVKEAAGIWDFLFSGIGGAASTKDEGGKSILDAIKGGNIGDFFNKDTLIKILTNFLLGGGIGLLAGELVEVLTQKVPMLKWFGDSKFIKIAIEGALTYAVMHSDFVTQLVNGIVEQIEQIVGMKKAPSAAPVQSSSLTSPIAPVKTENSGNDKSNAKV